jgi:Tfp pilus assembly protein PilX
MKNKRINIGQARPPSLRSGVSGQALVVLLVFMVVAIIMTTMAVALVIINATAASEVEQGDMALKLAESGAENALLRLVRDPTYTGTEITPLAGGTMTATVSAGNPIIIKSTGAYGQFIRMASVSARFIDTVLTIQNWQEAL